MNARTGLSSVYPPLIYRAWERDVECEKIDKKAEKKIFFQI